MNDYDCQSQRRICFFLRVKQLIKIVLQFLFQLNLNLKQFIRMVRYLIVLLSFSKYTSYTQILDYNYNCHYYALFVTLNKHIMRSLL